MSILMSKSHFAYGIFYFIVFIMAIYLVSHQLSGQAYTYISDTPAHLGYLVDYFDGTIYLPHPLWHICVRYMSYITLNINMAAILVTAVFIVFWLYVLHSILDYLLCEIKECNLTTIKTIIILSIIFLIGPAYLPFYSDSIYMGTWSPNVWHNVTLLSVKPFALLTVFFTILALQKKDILLYFLSTLFLIISMFAKPSFAIVFIPALLIYYLLKKEYAKSTLLFIIAMLIVFLGVAFFQFINTYVEGQGDIIIDFFGVWSLYSSNIIISILLGLFFPIIFFIFNPKLSIEDNWISFSWVMTIVAIIVFSTFAESGVRYDDANFVWSYIISMSLLYFFTIIKFVEIINDLSKYKIIILSSILLYQFTIGILYTVKVLIGHSFR